MKPLVAEYPNFLGAYVDLVKEEELISALENTYQKCFLLINSIPVEKQNFSYAPGKWTIKELLVHVIDTDRIFSYRALAFARGEKQRMPSFDENSYAENSLANQRSFKSIVEELEAVSKSTILLFKSIDPKNFSNLGETPAGLCSVNALGYAICGHYLHHLEVLKERYLK